MSLVPNYDSSSSNSESSDEEQPPQTNDRQSEGSIKLPPPSFLLSQTNPDLKTSVFKNPFTEAENAKDAILQKHVKMVETKDNLAVINGKKICWNYRKGRCRFGHNCKFAHDSDLLKTKEQIEIESQVQRTVVCEKQILPQPTQEQMKKIEEEAVKQNLLKRKKRPGLTQGLVPGKKVMKNYAKQKM